MIKIISIFDKYGKLLDEFSIDFLQREISELELDQESFYKKFGGEIPDQTIEMKIHEDEKCIFRLLEMDTHIHRGNDNNMYICYPSKLNSIEAAINCAKDWCLITMFHLTKRADVSWFESFGKWMVEETKSAIESDNELPKPFTEFPLWIQNGFLKWRVEIS